MPDRRGFLGAVAGVAAGAVVPMPAGLVGPTENGYPNWKSWTFTYSSTMTREKFLQVAKSVIDQSRKDREVLDEQLYPAKSVDKTG